MIKCVTTLSIKSDWTDGFTIHRGIGETNFTRRVFRPQSYFGHFSADVLKLVQNAPREIGVLINAEEADLKEVIDKIKNAVIIRYHDQFHIYSLHWAFAVSYWYSESSAYRNRGTDGFTIHQGNPEGGRLFQNIYVDGKRFDLIDNMCKICGNYLEKMMDLCSLLGSRCIQTGVPPFTWDVVSSKGSTNDWFDQHQTDFSKLTSLKSMVFKEAKTISVHKAFSSITFDTLSEDEIELNALKEERSDYSKAAAKTRRIRKTVCNGCLIKKAYPDLSLSCSANRTYARIGCYGPVYDEDYVAAYSANCKPWMLHALSLCNLQQDPSTNESLDFRGLVPSWKRCRIDTYKILGPYTRTTGAVGTGRFVLLGQIGIRTFRHHVINYASLCEYLKIDPVYSWEDLVTSKTSVFSDVPVVSYISAAAYLLSLGRSAETYASAYGHGGNRHYLVNIDVFKDEVNLEYKNRYSMNLRLAVNTGLSNIYDIPETKHLRESICFSESRKRENMLYHHFSVTNNIVMSTKVWRAIYAEHALEWSHNLAESLKVVSMKEMRKLVRLKSKELDPGVKLEEVP